MSPCLSVSILQRDISELVLSCRIYQAVFKIKNVYANNITQWAVSLRRDKFNFAALLSQCVLDWTPVWADCIWELPVCHQLRRRQPQSQDQCDPREPLQQLRLPGGDAGGPGRRTACVPPEAPTSRYSLRKAQISLNANSSIQCLLMHYCCICAPLSWLSAQPCMCPGSVWEGWRLLWHLSAEQQPQDPYLPLPLRIQPWQRWQVLQEWVSNF